MSDERFSAQGSWTAGSIRVLSAWLIISASIWLLWIFLSPGDSRSQLFLLVVFAVMSAALSPIYGGIAYAAVKRRERPLSAKGALWTTVILFVIGLGAAVYAYALVGAVGRGIR